MTRSGSAISTRDLAKQYATVAALRGISLNVDRGELFAILGPNGAGKSTLFGILATLRRPTSGTATVLGMEVALHRDCVRRHIGVVFQEPAIEHSLTARQNLALMGTLYGLPRSEARRRADRILERFELTGAAHCAAKALSGGQRRKLELARALVTDPEVLLLDEATLGLDVDARAAFWADVKSLARAGKTVVFATHYLEEAEVADRVAMLDRGLISAVDTPAALKARALGGRIRLKTTDNLSACAWLMEHGYRAKVTKSDLEVVHPEPSKAVPEILGKIPVRVEEVLTQDTSLEDVFIQITGRRPDSDTQRDPPVVESPR